MKVLAVLVAVALLAAEPPEVRAAPSPGPAEQLIVVTAPTADSAVGRLAAYERAGSQWTLMHGPMDADLGELGVGAPADDVFRTPTGTYPLGLAFGRRPNPGTSLPYTQVTRRDWWDEDVDSPTYNTMVNSRTKPSDDAENLYTSGEMYDYAVLVEHNPQRIPGRSAGIFLHVSDGEPTWGCIAVERDEMQSLLRWLTPSAHPRISIGVGPEPAPPTE